MTQVFLWADDSNEEQSSWLLLIDNEDELSNCFIVVAIEAFRKMLLQYIPQVDHNLAKCPLYWHPDTTHWRIV